MYAMLLQRIFDGRRHLLKWLFQFFVNSIIVRAIWKHSLRDQFLYLIMIYFTST